MLCALIGVLLIVMIGCPDKLVVHIILHIVAHWGSCNVVPVLSPCCLTVTAALPAASLGTR